MARHLLRSASSSVRSDEGIALDAPSPTSAGCIAKLQHEVQQLRSSRHRILHRSVDSLIACRACVRTRAIITCWRRAAREMVVREIMESAQEEMDLYRNAIDISAQRAKRVNECLSNASDMMASEMYKRSLERKSIFSWRRFFRLMVMQNIANLAKNKVHKDQRFQSEVLRRAITMLGNSQASAWMKILLVSWRLHVMDVQLATMASLREQVPAIRKSDTLPDTGGVAGAVACFGDGLSLFDSLTSCVNVRAEENMVNVNNAKIEVRRCLYSKDMLIGRMASMLTRLQYSVWKRILLASWRQHVMALQFSSLVEQVQVLQIPPPEVLGTVEAGFSNERAKEDKRSQWEVLMLQSVKASFVVRSATALARVRMNASCSEILASWRQVTSALKVKLMKLQHLRTQDGLVRKANLYLSDMQMELRLIKMLTTWRLFAVRERDERNQLPVEDAPASAEHRYEVVKLAGEVTRTARTQHAGVRRAVAMVLASRGHALTRKAFVGWQQVERCHKTIEDVRRTFIEHRWQFCEKSQKSTVMDRTCADLLREHSITDGAVQRAIASLGLSGSLQRRPLS